VLSRSRPLLAVGALGNGLIAALWASHRIWGLPLGPEDWKPDPLGSGDSVASAFELLLVAGAVVLLLEIASGRCSRALPSRSCSQLRR
jgi:hypothetical protein